jgi:hypothetical protein
MKKISPDGSRLSLDRKLNTLTACVNTDWAQAHSILLELISRLYGVNSGRILIDDVDVRDYSLDLPPQCGYDHGVGERETRNAGVTMFC